jgi:hypothetical protein
MTNLVVGGPTTCAWQTTELVSTLLSRSARDVVRHWISQKPFLGDDNQPRSLSFDASDEDDFNSLIAQVSPHLAPAIIRNELLRKGIVEQHENGSLLLRRSAYVPGVVDDENLGFNPEKRLVSGEVPRRRRNDLT